MKITFNSPLQTISGTYNKEIVNYKDFDIFKDKLSTFYESVVSSNDNSQTEKHLEKLLNNFLSEVFYKQDYYINSKSYKGLNESDLVIHNGNSFEDKVGVIFELKTPRNSEMITKDSFYKKSFYESVLYYLWEKFFHKNNEIHNIVISNFFEWFIIDSKEFEKMFNNKKVEKFFTNWRKGTTDSNSTKQMYNFIENYLKDNEFEIKSTHFLLKDYIDILENQDEKSVIKLIEIYKILSPKHLLNLKLETDSNSLNTNFYNELLYIIGLEEKKEKGTGKTLLIERKNTGSLLDITKNILLSESLLENLDYTPITKEEQLFNVSLELCITWVNRIIFLKLLETQLINYNGGKREFSFISSEKIESFQNLNQLFFEVLSERLKTRKPELKTKLKFISKLDSIPYLNSSLFEPTILEKKTLRISGLDDESEIELLPKSIVKNYDSSLKKTTTINYFLKFLECYDFGSTKKKLLTDKNKTIINSSVLGLIFEKINGYKDGSVFTPSFITSRMCEDTLEKIILKKFNITYNWNCENYIELHNQFDMKKIKDYNELINSIKICDPSVGSGHYLVSMLNEIIKVKYKLGLLCTKEYKRLNEIEINIEVDELIIRYFDGVNYEYIINENGTINPKIQEIQETIFYEKRKLIENCLFGVDINPNSVQICRLRLWIELLKSSFYTKESSFKELQTLPNIDINIKQGNSLIQKFSFDENLSSVFKGKFRVNDYKDIVKKYKDTNDKTIKETLKKYLKEIKDEFKSSIPKKLLSQHTDKQVEYNLYNDKLKNLLLFNEKVSKKEKEQLKSLHNKVLLSQSQIDEIKSNENYKESFEWRFEFPELINDKGEFIGFDGIIGNPPYVVVNKENYLSTLYNWNTDLYLMFFELSINKLLKDGGFLSFITPRFYLVNKNCGDLRKFFTDEIHTYTLIETNPFEEVNTECVITYIEKKSPTSELIPIYQETKKEFILTNQLEKPLIRKRDSHTIITFITKELDEVLDSIEEKSSTLISIYDESLRGIEIGKKELLKLNSGVKCLIGEDMDSFEIKYQNSFVNPKFKDYQRLHNFFQKNNMVLLRRVSKDLKSTINTDNYSFNKNIYGIALKDDYSNIFICGLLNSELLNFYYKCKYSTKKGDLFPEIQKYNYEQLPIRNTPKKGQKKIIDIVNKLFSKPKDEELMKLLNIEVYKLYEIEPHQIKIVQDFLK
jgi:adenine-specific DNA-methyltransferase